MQGIFVDAIDELAGILRTLAGHEDPPITMNIQAEIEPSRLPALLAGYGFVLNDHTFMPTNVMRHCPDLRHVIFLGTGARSYMDPEALLAMGIQVHTIKGYGDTAVAEHTIALMWAAARGLARMDAGIRKGQWLRTEGVQLTGKTIGLIGFGGIASEVARIAMGSGMRVLAWNRTPKIVPGVTFLPLDEVMRNSDVISIHLALVDETRGLISEALLSSTRPGALLINTARGAIVDEVALFAALKANKIGHAALDVFAEEPLPRDHPLAQLENVTLSAHSAFRTAEASHSLIRRALDIARDIART